MQRATGTSPTMSGTIVGYGQYHYQYASGPSPTARTRSALARVAPTDDRNTRGHRGDVERMAVAADWNIPPIAWVSDVVTPSTGAAASPRS